MFKKKKMFLRQKAPTVFENFKNVIKQGSQDISARNSVTTGHIWVVTAWQSSTFVVFAKTTRFCCRASF